MDIATSDNRNKFIVYVDESGDHSLEKIDEAYPIFVLAFCVFYQQNYIEKIIPAIEQLKFEKFGHDIVILHEREIRKELGPFGPPNFKNRDDKNQFLSSLTDIIKDNNFILISCVIDKRNLRPSLDEKQNPYHIALGHCLEALHDLLIEKGRLDELTHIVFEARGPKEDADLELEFLRLCSGENDRGLKYPFAIKLASKQVNSAGLQLADLVARPIGLSYLREGQQNRAFDALRPKFFCKDGRANAGSDYEGYGLKIVPAPKSEKPR